MLPVDVIQFSGQLFTVHTTQIHCLRSFITAFLLMLSSSFHTPSSFVIHILILCILITACHHDLGCAVALITTRNPAVRVHGPQFLRVLCIISIFRRQPASSCMLLIRSPFRIIRKVMYEFSLHLLAQFLMRCSVFVIS